MSLKTVLVSGRPLTILAFFILCRCAGGGLMHMMWMKKMAEKHHEHHEDHGGKSIGITFKPVAIPIPLPIAYVEKGGMKAQKPWPEESKAKGMMWKMMKMKMKMKMKMMKKMKMKMMKGSKAKGCCPMMQPQMKAAWPMMMPMMCPQMMMKGCGMMNGCMMKGGWPMKGGCPEEEEEEEEEERPEEDWPDYEDEEEMEDQYAWDTKQVPVYRLPNGKKPSKEQKRGDDFDERKSQDMIVWVKVKDTKIIGPQNKFDYDYDFDYIAL